ncbi:hypothetical protein J4419_06335 [Candidatus Woesearchaeota archaeon]|nr:hypothetical protein [Candidatus Woesearchaeota archaeon]
MATAVKKRWFPILAPKYFGDRLIGEVPAAEPKALIGKILTVNLFTLTDNIKRQNFEVSLVVDSVEGDAGHTSILGMRMIPTSIRRMIRKGRARLDITVRAITKKEEAVAVKLLLITKKSVRGSVYHALNNTSRNFVSRRIADSEFAAIAEELVDGRLAKDLKAKVNKIYPLRSCDVRDFRLERTLKAADVRRIKQEMANIKEEPVVVEEPMPEEEVAAQA